MQYHLDALVKRLIDAIGENMIVGFELHVSV
jgi:hypothetical protein